MERILCCSLSTRKALTAVQGPGLILLGLRLARAERSLASSGANAVKVLLELEDLLLEDYFRFCPEVTERDMRKLRASLDL